MGWGGGGKSVITCVSALGILSTVISISIATKQVSRYYNISSG